MNWWETGVITERHFLYREKTYRFRPDAQASVQLDTQAFRFWLEWDRGTMTLKDLHIKFTTYAMYLHSREWASSTPYLPAILWVTPDIAQEHQLTRAAVQRLVQVPSALCLYTTTASLLLTEGLLKPIWRAIPFSNQQIQGPPSALSQRVSLFASSLSAQKTS